MKKITPAEVASVINASPQFVRVAMQQGKLPIGTAIKMPNSEKWQYNITLHLLRQYAGEEAIERLKKLREEKNVEN